MIEVLGSLLASIVGSVIGVFIEIHFDLETRWQQRHIRKGRKLEERARRAYAHDLRSHR